MAIKTAEDLATACLNVAKNYKTFYVMGCFGAPMTSENKTRYTTNHKYNRKAARTKMINEASADTFGFDCVNLIKGLLWGWSGDTGKVYGGAKYASNGVPDTNADGMIQRCKDVSVDFSKIEVGEVVWMKGHIGVYIGDGLAVECTPAWKNCVQVTTVRNIKSGTGHKWTKHGKLPYVSYTGKETVIVSKSIEEIAKEVINGEWGNGSARKAKLTAAGYDYREVQDKVNELLKGKTSGKKTVDQLAKEVIQGKWGVNPERKKKLTEAGYDYAAVQKRVNKMLKG